MFVNVTLKEDIGQTMSGLEKQTQKSSNDKGRRYLHTCVSMQVKQLIQSLYGRHFADDILKCIKCIYWNQMFVSWWRHQIETCSALLVLCEGNPPVESTSNRCIPLTKSSDAELCFLWFAPEQTIEQTIKTQVIWDAIALIMTSLWWFWFIFHWSAFLSVK